MVCLLYKINLMLYHFPASCVESFKVAGFLFGNKRNDFHLASRIVVGIFKRLLLRYLFRSKKHFFR
ncbi:hypothetical protein C8K63_102164 [Pseudomonas sp. GV085]|nr:hypothetical protein C8K63_102164 [Pseudomonas sp. GV085]